jgi:AsmA protein
MPAPLVRRGLWPLISAALLIALFIVALPFVASTRIVRDRIAEEMSALSGYRVSIGAAPEIKVWPGFSAVLTDVSLHPWSAASDSRPVMTAERVEIDLSALAALHGNAEFSQAKLIRPTLYVSPDDTGLSLPVAPGGGKITRSIEAARQVIAENRTAPDIGKLPSDPFGMIEFSDGRVVSSSPGGNVEMITGLAGRADWPALNRRGAVSAKGRWNGEDVSFDLTCDNPLLLFAGGASQLSLALRSAPASLDFNGLASLAENPYVDGTAKFSTGSLSQLFNWAGVGPSPAVGAFGIEGRLAGDANRLRLESVELSLDGNPGQGGLELQFKGKLPSMSGTLAFDKINLSTVMAAFMPVDADGRGNQASLADKLNLDLRVSADTAAIGAVNLTNVAATARMSDGLAAFDISDAEAFGGSVQTGLRFDRKPDGIVAELRLLASDIDGGAFSAALGMTRLQPVGRGTISIILKGPGTDWESVMEKANGSISANFGAGALSGFDLQGFLDRTRKGGFFALDDVSKGSLPFDGLDLKASVSNGVARIDKAEVRSSQNHIGLTGIVPLAGRGLALTGFAGPIEPAVSPTARTGADFFVGGSWDAPFVSSVVNPPVVE